MPLALPPFDLFTCTFVRGYVFVLSFTSIYHVLVHLADRANIRVHKLKECRISLEIFVREVADFQFHYNVLLEFLITGVGWKVEFRLHHLKSFLVDSFPHHISAYITVCLFQGTLEILSEILFQRLQ